MTSHNPQLGKLHDAIKEIAPNEADKMITKYEKVQEGLHDILYGNPGDRRKDLAVDAAGKLKEMTGKILDAGSINVDGRRGELIKDFSAELGNVYDALGLGLTLDDAVEKSEAGEVFGRIRQKFGSIHFDLKVGPYVVMYEDISNPVPLGVIEKVFDDVFARGNESNEAKAALYANKDSMAKAFAYYATGMPLQAEESMKSVLNALTVVEEFKKFAVKAGLESLGFDHVKSLLTEVFANGVSIDQALSYIIDIRDLSKDEFEALKSHPVAFVNTISKAIPRYKGGEPGDKEYVRLLVGIGANFAKKKAEVFSRMNSDAKAHSEAVGELEQYSKENDVKSRYHADALKYFQLREAVSRANLAVAEDSYKLAVLSATNEMALAYIDKPKVQLGSMNTKNALFDIQNSFSAENIKSAAKKYGILDQVSTFVSIVTTAEIQRDRASSAQDVAAWKARKENGGVRGAYEAAMNGADLNTRMYKDEKAAIVHQLGHDMESAVTQSNKILPFMESEESYFVSLKAKYAGFSDIPDSAKPAVRARLKEYLSLMEEYYSIQGEILSVAASADFLGVAPTDGDKHDYLLMFEGGGEHHIGMPSTTMKELDEAPESPYHDMTWSEQIFNVRDEATSTRENMIDLAVFFGAKNRDEVKVPTVDDISSPEFADEFIALEVKPLVDKYTGRIGDVGEWYQKVDDQKRDLAMFANGDTEKFRKSRTALVEVFNRGLRSYQGLIDSVESTIDYLENGLKGELSKMKSKVENNEYGILQTHPQLKPIWLNKLAKAEEHRKYLLDSAHSPVSHFRLQMLKAGMIQLEDMKSEHLWSVAKGLGAFVIIVGAACAGGVAGAEIASSLFGLGAGATVTLGETALITAFGSAGGVVGKNLGMMATNKLGLTKFADREIWNREDMLQEFAYGWLISFAAVGSAHVIVERLNAAALGGSANAARALDKLGWLKSIASPSEWFGMSSAGGPRAGIAAFARRFGLKVGVEGAEEGAEMASGKVTQMLTKSPHLAGFVEFLVAVVNSSDGMNVELNMVGIDADVVGIKSEGDDFVYTTETAQEFAANMKANFEVQGQADVQTTINEDGSVDVVVSGKSVAQSITINVKPATTGLSQDVMVKRMVNGKQLESKVNPTTGETEVHVTDSENVMPVLINMMQNGSALTEVEGGFLCTDVEGNQVHVKMDAKMASDLNQQLTDAVGKLDEAAKALKIAKRGPLGKLLDRAGGAKTVFGSLLVLTAVATDPTFSTITTAVVNAFATQTGDVMLGDVDVSGLQVVQAGGFEYVLGALLVLELVGAWAPFRLLNGIRPSSFIGNTIRNARGNVNSNSPGSTTTIAATTGVELHYYVPSCTHRAVLVAYYDSGKPELTPKSQDEFRARYERSRKIVTAMRFETTAEGELAFNRLAEFDYAHLRLADIEADNGAAATDAEMDALFRTRNEYLYEGNGLYTSTAPVETLSGSSDTNAKSLSELKERAAEFMADNNYTDEEIASVNKALTDMFEEVRKHGKGFSPRVHFEKILKLRVAEAVKAKADNVLARYDKIIEAGRVVAAFQERFNNDTDSANGPADLTSEERDIYDEAVSNAVFDNATVIEAGRVVQKYYDKFADRNDSANGPTNLSPAERAEFDAAMAQAKFYSPSRVNGKEIFFPIVNEEDLPHSVPVTDINNLPIADRIRYRRARQDADGFLKVKARADDDETSAIARGLQRAMPKSARGRKALKWTLGLAAGVAVGSVAWWMMSDKAKELPQVDPRTVAGTPEYAAATTAAEGGASAARTVDDLNASAKAAEIERKISEFKSTYTMLELTKTDELGYSLTEDSTSRLTEILAGKKSYLLENGYTNQDIATLKEEARSVFNSSSSAGEEPPAAGEEPPAAGEEPPAAGEEPPAAGEEPPAPTTIHGFEF